MAKFSILRDGKSIELTPEEVEGAYRAAELEYIMSDIRSDLDAINIDRYDSKFNLSESDIRAIAQVYTDKFDADLSHWSNIRRAILRYVDGF